GTLVGVRRGAQRAGRGVRRPAHRARSRQRSRRAVAGRRAAINVRRPAVEVLTVAGQTEAVPGAQGDLRRRAWRWHFLAAVLVIPFVLWQSATGVLYLWSEHWVDHRHAQLRFVEQRGERVSLDTQVQAARVLHAGRQVGAVRVSSD